MVDRLINGGLSTLIIILIVPIVGMLIDFLTSEITRALAKSMGASVALFIMNGLTFVGTIHHELSHAFYAFITGAKVTKVQVFKPEDGRLGYVEFSPRGNWFTKSLQLTFAGIAPMIQGAITEVILFWVFFYVTDILWVRIVLGYIMFSIFIHMTMSTEDMKAAVKGLPIVAVLVFIICFAFNIDLFGFFKGLFVVQHAFL